MSSKISPIPEKKSNEIFIIHDKKAKGNGMVDYLVEFKGSDAQFWESDQELGKVKENINRMEAFNVYLDEEKQLNHFNFNKAKELFQMGKKSKSIKKEKNIAKEAHKMKQPKEVHEISSDSSISESGNEEESLSSRYSSKSDEESEKKQIPKENLSKRPKVPVILPENICKITEAMFHSKSKILFKSKSMNGTFEWVSGDEMKKRNPIALIRFYEKKINWK